MSERATKGEIEERIWDIQQECARLDFVTRGEDKTARWVAHELVSVLAAQPVPDSEERDG